MYPISNEVKTLFESEQKQILRITGGEKSPISKSVGPSAIASFSDAIAADALNLSVDIAPVQSGSGDPSPTNVRPISGWTGAKVTVSPSQNAQDGTTYDITFPTEAGTVYGGTLDVTTGLLTVTHKILELDGVTSGKKFIGKSSLTTADQYLLNTPDGWAFDAGRNRFVTDEEADTYGLRCSVGEYYSAWSGFGSKYCYTAYIELPRLQMRINFLKSMGIDTIKKANEWAAGLYAAGTPCQFIYPLATPITYQLTPTQIALLEGVNNVWADCGDVTVEYATGYEYEINITDADVVIGSFSIDRFSCIGNKLEIGTATSAQMTVKLDNYDGRFNGIVFEGTELFVEIGIADWTQSNPTVNWIPCGYFTPDEQPRSLNIITIHALDRMMQFDATMPTLTPWVTQSGDVMTDSQGNIIYFVSNVQFPVTVQNLVKRVALLCGVPFTQSLSNLPNYNYTLSALPTLQQEITFRNIIQWCAGIMGANAWIDWTGLLRFSWYGATTGYTSTTANRFSSDLHEDDITITGVQYTNTQNVTIVSGSADYAIDMTGNYLAAVGISTILPNVKNVINGFSYRPFTASVINAPYLWPMDMITFVKDGVNHTCAVTNVNFGINGTTALEGKGETAQTNSGTAPSGVTPEQGFLIEQAAEVTRKLDESLDQEGVFNRLTDNGEVQGLFLYNGKIYLNAEYIQTGTLVANLLMAGILTIGGENNGNGQIKILDSNGNVIGTWDKNGISVTKGSITGGTINGATLTLGGANNTSGTLTVKDASGNTIGTWNNNGLTLDKGSINLNNGVFKVESTGALTASNANIQGSIVSTGTDIYGNTLRTSINAGVINVYGVSDTRNYFDLSGYTSSYDSLAYTLFNATSNLYIQSKSSGQGGHPLSGYIWIDTDYRGKATIRSDNLDLKSYDNVSYMLFETTSYGGHSLSFNTATTINGNFQVAQGYSKSKVIHTEQYGDRLLYCYETPSPMFGDVGEGTIGEDGKCYIWLDPVFAQTITTTQYQVFLQRYGSGECWVSERNGGYFVVEGTPGMAFGWEIKGKQADIDQRRLERNDKPFTIPKQTYGEDAAKYIDDLRKERLSA